MNIGIDYDETFSADPELFLSLIALCQGRGHTCYIVTARSEERCNGIAKETGLEVISTGQRAKARVCFERCLDIDIWIDDFPFSVCFDIERKYQLDPA